MTDERDELASADRRADTWENLYHEELQRSEKWRTQIVELRAQIERMKCCENCGTITSIACIKCYHFDKWEAPKNG